MSDFSWRGCVNVSNLQAGGFSPEFAMQSGHNVFYSYLNLETIVWTQWLSLWYVQRPTLWFCECAWREECCEVISLSWWNCNRCQLDPLFLRYINMSPWKDNFTFSLAGPWIYSCHSCKSCCSCGAISSSHLMKMIGVSTWYSIPHTPTTYLSTQ